ncbi:MAG: ABC transporter ATP-binding protein [Bacteroidia bacterium]|nr:ABC transporter ATP-binding protein [Bacteroidia bacterium]MBP9923356.1 ABC transporter ATP-binding protein [Bacteroidia bacterium]
MNSPLLEIKNLSTDFTTEAGKIAAISDVTFMLNRGETIGIVGESGSGKSVTALSIMRLLAKTATISSGEINFYNQENRAINLLSLPEEEMRKYRGNELAMIFQEPMTSLNPVISCGKQVAEALILHKKISKQDARLRTIELFEKVKLPRAEKLFDSYPHQISGGQKQRVMIAMAMSCDPAVLIADEPTTALDVTVQASIIELMHQIQEEKKMGLLFITHDLGVVSEIANRVVVMYNGKIVENGTTENIFNNPQHPYTKALLACRPPLHKKLYRLPTITDFMKENSDGSFTEIKKSVEESLTNFEIDKLEISKHHHQLFAQEPILQVKNLCTWFPVRNGLFGKTTDHIKAVNDVSFDVYPGETLGLVGESGCGKTTLGRSIIRLIEPTSGQVIFKKKDFSTLEGRELRRMRKHIQIIFQDPYSSLNPRMAVGKAIMEPMQVHGLYDNDEHRRNKVIELMERVSLNERQFNRLPHEFSGGQRQRICIARAIAMQPEFIICDESVSALDVSIQAQVLNLLNELKRDFNFTYIFISHDMSVVKFMSDRMIVMNNGKIEEIGDPEEIYTSPKSEYTKRLIDAIPGGVSSFQL